MFSNSLDIRWRDLRSDCCFSWSPIVMASFDFYWCRIIFSFSILWFSFGWSSFGFFLRITILSSFSIMASLNVRQKKSSFRIFRGGNFWILQRRSFIMVSYWYTDLDRAKRLNDRSLTWKSMRGCCGNFKFQCFGICYSSKGSNH